MASALVAAASLICAPGASAAHEKSMGVCGGFSSYNTGGYAKVYFDYSFHRHFRTSFSLGYSFRAGKHYTDDTPPELQGDRSAFLLDLDLHFPFRVAKAFYLYPFTGFCYNNWSYTTGTDLSRAGGNFGLGAELVMTPNLKINIEGKYALMKDTSGFFAGIGFAYIF